MVSFSQAQTGNRVYNGVGQSPNRGQVSAKGAQGYINREVKNKKRTGVVTPVGRDGKSDNRSAVAAKALNRRGVGFQKVGNGNLNNKNKPLNQVNKGRPQVNKPKAGGNSKGVPVGNKGPVTPAVQVPQVTVTEDGILQLPYNQEFAAEQYSAVNDANSQLLGLKSEADQQGLDYTKATRDASLAYQSLQNQTLNNNAASGTAFSSQYGTGVSNNATGYANQVGDLQSQNNSFLQNQTLQKSAIQDALNQQLASGAQAYGNQVGEEAGTLGYGTGNLGNSPKGPTKPNKTKYQNNHPKQNKPKSKHKKKGAQFQQVAKRSLQKKRGK